MNFNYVLSLALLGICYMSVAYVLAFANKKLSDYFAYQRGYNTDYQIEEKSNLAVALRRFGLYLGLGIGMYGVISGPSQGLLVDMVNIFFYGMFVSVLFLVARFFNDLVILNWMDNTKEVFEEDNEAVGLVECGGYLATGVIAMASVTGEGGGIGTAIAFFLIGQAMLLLVARIYEAVTAWNVEREIKRGNPAAGLALGGIMVAIAIAIHGAIAIDFESWSYNLTVLAFEGTLAVVFMLMLSAVIDRFFLPNTDVKTEVERDQNVAAIVVLVSMKIFGALMITAAVV